ncbi:MAG TPA: GFA family protein [Chromatiales bacterium]|nr:GFA family protein [Chromatiales bacterium]
MDIEGSCFCGAVHFRAVSHTPYPYLRCYCSFCCKTSGSGGYAINIMAQADSLRVRGDTEVGFHHGREHDPRTDQLVASPGKRFFCRHCGSPLWGADPRWAEWFYPFASAIDTPLPQPPETVHIMLEFTAPWVTVPEGEGHRHFPRYPDASILEWHRRWGLIQP